MYGSIALFALLASMAEAAIIPLDFKRNIPAAREQVLAQRDAAPVQPSRRLVRRRKDDHVPRWDDGMWDSNKYDGDRWSHNNNNNNGNNGNNDGNQGEDENKCNTPSSTSSTSESAPSPSFTGSPPWDGWLNDTNVTPTPTPSSSIDVNPPQSTSKWHHVDTIAGANFFDPKYWNWWSWDDPTHGDVTYVDAGTAWNDGLVSVNKEGRAIMKVETTQQVNRGRKSVRIHGNRVWTGGMVMMDAVHMPAGCGTWPAWWQNGPNWPEGGEIDILEGVNAFTKNQVSLHTGRGCTMPNNLNDNQLGTMTTGNFDSFDCSSANTANQGCGVHDKSTQSYGDGFNEIGGGVYVLAWQKSGITAWFHPRYNIPADITEGSPNPDAWGTPVAHFPSSSCSPYQFFYDHFNIFDTTLCGDWAGADSVWHQSGYAGQEQSCAAITGYSSCIDYVRNNGNAFNNAFWEVK